MDGLMEAQTRKSNPCHFVVVCYNDKHGVLFIEEGGARSMDNTKRINIALNEALHRKLKIAAATKGVTVKEYVTEAICDKLEKGETERGKKHEPTKQEC